MHPARARAHHRAIAVALAGLASTGCGGGSTSLASNVASEAGAAAARRSVPADAHPVFLARAIVAGIVQALAGADRLPAWSDPLGEVNAAPSGGVSGEALSSFLRGLAAEEVRRWEEARRGYAAAAADPRFPEARTALARTVRLRLGGTLAES